MLVQECPCGSGSRYDACCGRFHRGADLPPTAEALMRSRYSAFVVGESDYLFTTWHPRTRPDDVAFDRSKTWTRLEILETVGGGPDDAEGVVEFVAHYSGGRQHERSRFVRRAGRWVYVDAER